MKKGFLKKYEWLAVLLILLAGAVLRVYALGAYPAGLNQDEASTGYEAWALLNYGVDRNGYAWPVLLKSWGSGQNALYSYLAMPFIKIFGLTAFSLRLVSASVGILTLLVFWLFARRCRGRAFALCALFVLALNPYHIGISRWALESNILPFFLLCGVLCTAMSEERQFFLIPAAAFFGLGLYAYGTAFIFVPLFAVSAAVWLYSRRALRPRSLIPAIAVFIVLALPITICQAANILGRGDISFLGLSLPKLTEARQLSTTVFGSSGVSGAIENFRAFLGIMYRQSDGLPYNALPRSGLYYVFGLPCAAVGLAAALGKRRYHPGETPMLLFLAVSFVAAFLISPNINRMNMAWLPIIYFSAVGIYIIMQRAGDFGFVPILALLVSFTFFAVEYRGEYVENSSEFFYPGLGQAIEYAAEIETGPIFVTTQVNQPYIFVLFYAKIPPQEYLDSVRFVNPGGAFEHVSGFGRYRFADAAYSSGLSILHISESKASETIAQFGDYIIIKR